MNEALENLFQCREVKAFAKQFKELQEEWEEPLEFVRQAAPYLAPRLYHPYYDEDTPHSLFGVSVALDAASLFPEEQRWWPFVQQAWHAANERLRRPLPWEDVAISGKGSAEERWEVLKAMLPGEDFEQSYGLARGLYEESPEFLIEKLTQHAFQDSAQGGLEFLLVSQYLRLLEVVGPEAAPAVLAGAVHFLVFSPRDCKLAGEVGEFARGRNLPVKAEAKPEAADYQNLESNVLFGDRLDEALRTAADWASRAGLETLWDGLLLAGINAVCNSRPGHWVRPARALLTAFLARRQWGGADPSEQTKVVLHAIGMLHQASARSRHGKSNRDLEEVARQLLPLDPLNTLRSVVSHSDPMASATAVYALLGWGEGKHRELFENLATLAAKNDGRMGRGYDLLTVTACIEAFQTSRLNEKDRFLSGCAFFLGRLRKDYELFGAYGT